MKDTLIIFDLDGTLLDSMEDLAIATNKVLKDFGFATHELIKFKNFVGDGAKELLRRALPKDASSQKLEEALILFKKYYSNKTSINTKPYDGIYEMLDRLQESCELCLLSNKPHKFTVEYMELFFKDYDFKQIHGQKDDVPRKPDPQGIYNILDELETEYKKIFYIGDTATDMKTAINAKKDLILIAVSWGYHDQEVLLENGAKLLASSPYELGEIILNH